MNAREVCVGGGGGGEKDRRLRDQLSHVRQHCSPQHRILGVRKEESSSASGNKLTASFTGGQREQEDERSAVCRLSLILVRHLRGSAKLKRPVQRES